MESVKFVSLALYSSSPYSVVTFNSSLRNFDVYVCSDSAGMLGKSLTSPILTFDSAAQSFSCTAESPSVSLSSLCTSRFPPSAIRAARTSNVCTKKWIIHSTAQIDDVIKSDEDQGMWEACRQALSVFDFSVEEKDKILGKAFGLVNSPYWGEERKKEVPKLEKVNEILEYLRSLSLSDEDLSKLIKKFPEVLGCSLEDELKTNVQILEKEWGIKGKSLRNLLLRNPKVLGYNVDCKGDCMAQCTRCWVRF